MHIFIMIVIVVNRKQTDTVQLQAIRFVHSRVVKKHIHDKWLTALEHVSRTESAKEL